MRRIPTLHLTLSLLAVLSLGAGPLRREDVPQPLAPWVDWVLRGHEAERCPFLYGNAGLRVCQWPSRLELALDAQGGRFAQEIFAETEGFVRLPGDAAHWPEDVRVDGRAAAVVEREGHPQLRLAAGSHRLEGRFAWRELPQLLAVPAEVAVVALAVGGQPVPFPQRDAASRLWLGRPPAATDAGAARESRVEVEVHRRIADEVPLRLTTHVALRVSGPAREVALGPALPAGLLPLALEGALPARLEPDGSLRVQVRPGRFVLVLDARSEGPVAALGPPAREAGEAAPAWDDEEVWVFDARPALRLVDVEDGTRVDPQQTQLPEDWKALPAWRLRPGEQLRLVERRRGDAEPTPDRLEIERSFHLDFDGRGATVSDAIGGELRTSSRLEMGEATQLGRVAVNGVDQFVTRRPGAERAGVEVPLGPVWVTADSRIESEGRVRRLPAVGWDVDFAGAAGRLELPPGWRLLHAGGVDRAHTTWLNRWTLLDLFVVLVVAMALLRMWGVAWGSLALLTLALTYTEPGAPRALWIAVVVAEALRRVVRPGRLARAVALYRAAALAALVLVTIPFAVRQVREGLFPALERPFAFDAGGMSEPMPTADAATSMQMPAAPPGEARESLRALGYLVKEESAAGLASSAPPRRSSLYSAYPDPTARITTGPGVPDWRWETVHFTWSGPVARGQEVRLVLLPPLANGVLAVLRTALLGALVLQVLGASPGRVRRWLSRAPAAAGLLAFAALHASAPARAEVFPPPELLDELRSRLLAMPDCHPLCAASPRLRLEVGEAALVARLEVHADAETAVPLPGGAGDWGPAQVLVDGSPAEALWRDGEGGLWLRLAPGSHQVLLSGALPPRDTVEIALPLRPRQVEWTASGGWSVQGVADDGSVEGALQLMRTTALERTPEVALEQRALPPFVTVERSLELGLAWQVTTRVERLSPVDVAAVLEIPLLEGESPTTAWVRVTDGRARVSFGPGVREVGWISLLPQRDSLSLAAPTATPWSETWRVDASPIWHVEASGIPAVQSGEGGRLREWRPWPGESVVLQVERPEGVGGSTLTVDSVALESRPGVRATDATLSLVLRSSQGGPHVLRLPEGAELQSLSVNGVPQPVRQEGRELTLALSPGSQSVALELREPRGISAGFRGSEVDLGLPSVNAHVSIAPPPSRWILAVGGPRLGPAVLFWPLLAVLAVVAGLLARVPLTPLRFHHWLLLGIGLTQVPVWASGIVAAWLVALGWREREGTRVPGRSFDLLQVGLVALTGAALGVLFLSIQKGLLGQPEMQIAGNGSSAELLRWYQDRSPALLPQPWVLSVPLLVYRLAMLAWALWIAQALVGWLRWGWRCFSAGELWRPLRATRVA